MATRPGGRAFSAPQHLDQPEHLVGQVLDGRYLIGAILSSGGMGFIFQGTQLSTSREVAIKVLKPSLAHGVMVDRFRQEFEVLGSLNHQNVVQLIDSGRSAAGLHYLVMELVEGRTLGALLREERTLTIADLLDIFAQISRALFEAHSKAIVHRDLKLENVMVLTENTGDRLVKVLDFGVAKNLGSDSSLTQGGQLPGTPGIIAPELVAGAKPTPRSDLYSLGVLMYTALAGKPPFEGTEAELLQAHQHQRPPPLAHVVPSHHPQALLDLVEGLMAKAPEERPRDAHDVRLSLRQIERDVVAHGVDLPVYAPMGQSPQPTWRGEGGERLMTPTPPQKTGELRASSRLKALIPPKEERALIVPSSVVTALAILLMALIVCVLYLVVPLLLG